MSKFDEVFNKKAFIAFLTAGDPNILATEQFIYKMIEAGVSLIEIGIPFSDPIAEGKTIFNADMRALASGTTTDKIFSMVKRVREKYPDFPMVFMTYLNPVFSYGYEKFFKNSMDCNMLGVIIPDLPYEEHNEASIIAKKYNQTVISMIAPTSKKRIEAIAKEAEGFIYLVSSLGVTGVRSEIKTDLDILDELWTNRPKLPFSSIYVLDNVYCGEGYQSKLERLKNKMNEYNCDTHILSSLTDQAWLFNLRGNDIENVPVFLSFLIISTQILMV